MTWSPARNDDRDAPARTVALVDAHVVRRETLAEALEELGWHVRELAPEDDPLEHIRTEPPDVVLTDVGGESHAGGALARRLRLDPDTATLAIVGTSATSVPSLGVLALFDRFVPAPLDPCELDRAMRALLPRAR